jgi:hypothetical protein
MTVKCLLCGKELKTSQALRGHLNFKHKLCKETEKVREIEESIRRREVQKMTRELEPKPIEVAVAEPLIYHPVVTGISSGFRVSKRRPHQRGGIFTVKI